MHKQLSTYAANTHSLLRSTPNQVIPTTILLHFYMEVYTPLHYYTLPAQLYTAHNRYTSHTLSFIRHPTAPHRHAR